MTDRRHWFPLVLSAIVVFFVTWSAESSRNDRGFRTAAVPLLVADTEATLPLPRIAATVGRRVLDGDTQGAVLAGAVVIGLAVAVSGVVAWQLAGPVAAIFCVLLMLAAPRTLFHARTLGPEAIACLSIALVMWASIQRHHLVLAIGGTFALALALGSHHESLPLLLAWLLAMVLRTPGPATPECEQGYFAVGSLPVGALMPLIAAPVLGTMCWPWLQEHGLAGFISVFLEPYTNPHQPFLVLHEVYDQSIGQAPGTLAGLLYFLISIPLITGLIATLGLRGLDKRALFVPVGLTVLVFVQCLNGGPHYNDTDGIMHCLPFIAVLGGLGATRIWRITGAASAGINGTIAACVTLAILIGPSALDTALVYPLESGYRNGLVGGRSGSARMGLETRSDFLLLQSELDWINTSLPPNAQIAFQPAGDKFRPLMDALRTAGLLRSDIQPAATYHATHLVIAHTPGYPLYQDALRLLGDPLYENRFSGVRHMSVIRF